MTRKDYIIIANSLLITRKGYSRAWNPDASLAFDMVCENLADVFTKDNPKFDREKFLEACGV